MFLRSKLATGVVEIRNPAYHRRGVGVAMQSSHVVWVHAANGGVVVFRQRGLLLVSQRAAVEPWSAFDLLSMKHALAEELVGLNVLAIGEIAADLVTDSLGVVFPFEGLAAGDVFFVLSLSELGVLCVALGDKLLDLFVLLDGHANRVGLGEEVSVFDPSQARELGLFGVLGHRALERPWVQRLHATT